MAFFSAVDIDHVLRKEPNMTCLTPSHEEKISEGSSCTLLDTVDALNIETNSEGCLLGESKEMDAAQIEPEAVNEILKKVKMNLFKDTNLPFLKAQMFKDYKANMEPSVRGNRETRKVIKYKKETSNLSCK